MPIATPAQWEGCTAITRSRHMPLPLSLSLYLCAEVLSARQRSTTKRARGGGAVMPWMPEQCADYLNGHGAARGCVYFYAYAPVHIGHLLDRFVCPIRQHREHVPFAFLEPFSRNPRLRFKERRPRFRLNGGTVHIDSSPEKGTCVTCMLPAQQPREAGKVRIVAQEESVVPPQIEAGASVASGTGEAHSASAQVH